MSNGRYVSLYKGLSIVLIVKIRDLKNAIGDALES